MLQFHFVDVINYAFEAKTISSKEKEYTGKNHFLGKKRL